jgi:hypothetical protein
MRWGDEKVLKGGEESCSTSFALDHRRFVITILSKIASAYSRSREFLSDEEAYFMYV